MATPPYKVQTPRPTWNSSSSAWSVQREKFQREKGAVEFKKMAPPYSCFFKIMAPQFQNKLIIPKQFMDRFEGRLGSSCILRGPTENEWWVHVRQARGSTSFSEGWSGFVVDHGVNLGDYLVFTYTGNSSFKVSIYDLATEIEQPSALLAHNSSTSPPSDETDDDHGDDDMVHIEESDDNDRVDDWSDSVSGMFGGDQGQEELSDTLMSRVCTRAQTQARRVEKPTSTGPASRAQTQARRVEKPTSTGPASRAQTQARRVEKPTTTGPASQAQTQARRPKKTATVGPASQARAGPSTRSHGGRDKFYRKGCPRTSSPDCGQLKTVHISKRRRVTGAEIEEAHYSAVRYMCSHNNHLPKFQVTLLPTSVYLGLYLTIPKTWALENMPQRHHNVKLKVAGQRGSWTVGCRWSSIKQCQLRPQWSRFVLDNNLEEHDVCVFELVHAGSEARGDDTVFNVNIFRVVVPPEPLVVERRRVE